MPVCPIKEFVTKSLSGNESDECPADTAVGVAVVDAYEPHLLKGVFADTVPLFNLEPRRGEPARLGFFLPINSTAVYIDPAVRTGSDYGVTVNTTSITQTAAFLSAHVTVWGVPGAAAHDGSRGWACVNEEPSCSGGPVNPPAFLTMPTSCTGSLVGTVEGDSWQQPGQFQQLASYEMPGLEGCGRLQFAPVIHVTPDGQDASTPTGLTVDVHVPQEVDENGGGLASSDVKDITVTLPEGMRLNPSAADGLQACSEGQVGFTGIQKPALTCSRPRCRRRFVRKRRRSRRSASNRRCCRSPSLLKGGCLSRHPHLTGKANEPVQVPDGDVHRR